MIAPAAPLEKAVEGARKALDRWDKRADPHPEGAGLAISLRSLLAALDADKRGLETLLEYAYGYDNKPHQFWLHAKMAAERIGRTDLVSEFAEWYETPPGFDADNRLEVPE